MLSPTLHNNNIDNNNNKKNRQKKMWNMLRCFLVFVWLFFLFLICFDALKFLDVYVNIYIELLTLLYHHTVYYYTRLPK